jgi:ribosomal protein S18 acetylase RimI-like enzyme
MGGFVPPTHSLARRVAVYHFRPFLNSDPPHLTEIWRSQPSQRGVMQPMSAGLFEQLVLSKPYFDREGLILALHDGQPVGFAHAGFGPTEAEDALSTDMGTTYLLMLHGDHRDAAVADELMIRSEGYLRERGAKVIYGGGIQPLNAFYLGLYGGSELPGILATDVVFLDACRRNGYREIDQVLVLQRELAQFRVAISWEQRRLRRSAVCNEIYAPPSKSWWEACTTGAFERLNFSLQNSPNGLPLSSVGFWDIEPLSTGWGAATAGMFDLHVSPEARRQGLATFLLGEAFNRLRSRGIVLVEAQTMRGNTPALAMYQKLGFQNVDSGYVFRKGE